MTTWVSGQVLTAADLNATLAAKVDKDGSSVKDFGLSTGASSAANGLAIAACEGSPSTIMHVPPGTYQTDKAPSQLNKTYVGDGTLVLNGDYLPHKLPNVFSYTSTAPSTPSNPGDPANAFTGSSKSPWRYQSYVVGSSTAGTPTTGYTTAYDLGSLQMNTYVDAGHNESTTDAVGRTMIPQTYSYGIMRGQGDYSSFLVGGYAVNPTPTRSSHWLADPAMTALAGEFDAQSNSLNLVAAEYTVRDNGFAVTLSGYGSHIYRDNLPSPNPKHYVAVNFSATSNGSQPVDAFYYGSGKARLGVDFTAADFSSTSGAALVTKAGQYWFGNGVNSSFINTPDQTAPGTPKFGYDGSAWMFTGVVGFASLINAANDAAAATAGVPVNGAYRNGSILMVRVS